MTARNLLLSGGPGHDFGAVASTLDDLFAEQGLATTVVDEPADAVAALRRAAHGDEPAFSLFTVHALHWRMEAPHYAHLRDRMARSLGRDELAVIDGYVRGGGGLLALHTAVICFDADPVWRALCGAAWDWTASSHPPLDRVPVRVTDPGRRHPITSGVADFAVDDEQYGFLDADDDLVPLLVGARAGGDPLLWARSVGAGRVVTDLLGHGPASIVQSDHRCILGRAAAWARRDNPDRTRDE